MLVSIYSTEVCANCRKLYELVLEVVNGKGIQADVQHITDPKAIAEAGIISSPALVIDELTVSSGWLPGRREIERWLERGAASGASREE